jgi:predicted ATP-dependent serine protease
VSFGLALLTDRRKFVSCDAGCGKTTLLSQLTVDFAQQNRSTLWASFEGTKDKLITKLVQQYYKTGTFTKLPRKEQHRVRIEFVCVKYAVVFARQ